MPAETTPAVTTNVFLFEDLEDVSRTSELARSDLGALDTVADWIKSFIVRPHKDLGARWAGLSIRACVLGT
jgi:hypothetical protein